MIWAYLLGEGKQATAWKEIANFLCSAIINLNLFADGQYNESVGV